MFFLPQITSGKTLLCNILNCMLLLETYQYTSILSDSMMVSSVEEVCIHLKMRKQTPKEATNVKKIEKKAFTDRMNTRIWDVEKQCKKDTVMS